ncbi:exonuclease SbcCD subunit D [Anaerolentibacter hominis]|uniref:exonuclease SbcCD subunit D n=1 Tax=Anaerolentibacter hominis TaxID=3079009 RepID=UPI0031B8A69D
MKIMHLADLHIGKNVNGFSMLPEQEYVLDQILNIVKEENVDGVLLAGDLYDRPVPSAEAVTLMDRFLTALSGFGVFVIAISGNHDSPERIQYMSGMLKEQRMYLNGRFQVPMEKITLEDGYGPVHFYLLPFARPAVMAACMGTEDKTCGACVKSLLERTSLNEKERNIIVLHHFVTGGGDIVEEMEGELALGGTESVDVHFFDRFDYVAMGHIHRGQRLIRETVRYAGSPLKYSFSEEGHTKRAVLITLKDKGNAEIHFHELMPRHDLRSIRGRLSDLIDPEIVKLADPADYLKVTLTDDTALLEPMKSLRAVYPNVMQLVLERTLTEGGGSRLTAGEVRRRTPKEMFREFYTGVCGQEFTEEKEALLDELLAGGAE